MSSFYSAPVMMLLAAAAVPEEVRKVVDASLAAPPEIAADALIRVAASPAVQDRQYAADLLARAFELAEGAAHPFARVGRVGAAAGTDTDIGRLSQALAPGLDGLSLKVRSARALFQLDKAKGLDAFFRLGPLRYPPLACRDSSVWTTGTYYEFVREVFDDGFTPLQRKEGRHVGMLEDQVRAFTSPFQLEPLARILANAKMADSEFERLAAVFATGLKSLQADDRSFTSGTRHGFTQAIFDVMARCRKAGLSTLPILDAYKTYLQNGLTGKRCEDSADAGGEGAYVDHMVTLLNGELRKVGQEPLVVRRVEDNIVHEKAEVFVFWSGAASKKLFDRLGVLVRREGMKAEEWEPQVREYLNDLREWDRNHGESAVNYFHQRAMLYTRLVAALPAGALRSSVTDEYLSFLVNSPVERQSPPEWYLYARDVGNLAGEEAVRRAGHSGLLLMLDLPRVIRRR